LKATAKNGHQDTHHLKRKTLAILGFFWWGLVTWWFVEQITCRKRGVVHSFGWNNKVKINICFLRGVVNFVQLAGVFVSCVSFVLGKKYWIKMRQKIGR